MMRFFIQLFFTFFFLLSPIHFAFTQDTSTIASAPVVLLSVSHLEYKENKFIIEFHSTDGIITTITDSSGAALLALLNQALIQDVALKLRDDKSKISSLLELKVKGWSSQLTKQLRNILMRLAMQTRTEKVETTTRVEGNSTLTLTQLNAKSGRRLQDLQNRITSPKLSFDTLTYGDLNYFIGHFFYHWGAYYSFESTVKLSNGESGQLSGGPKDSFAFQSPRQTSYTQVGVLLNNFNNVVCDQCLSAKWPVYLLDNTATILKSIEQLEFDLF